MLNFSAVMLGKKQPKELAQFYEQVLEKAPDWADGSWSGWQIGNTHLTIGEHSEVAEHSKEPQRIILNFETKEVQKEFERIKETGAKVIKEPYEMGGMWIATFADPDGNYFQLITPWEGEK